jgi:hypothetical protein
MSKALRVKMGREREAVSKSAKLRREPSISPTRGLKRAMRSQEILIFAGRGIMV